jgi:tetratricopeptide (TPR) repeat protein
MKKFFVVMFFAFGLSAGQAQDFQKVFDTAEKLYKENKFSEAIAEYQVLEKLHYGGKELYYNMGNCYYKANMYGMAVAYYEKALKYDPADEDIQANLRLVNSKTEDKINEEEKGLAAWFKQFVNIMAADKWAKLGVALWLIGFLGFILFKVGLMRKSIPARALSWFGVVIGALCLVFGYFNYRMVSRHNTAVIISPLVQVKSSPSETAKKLYDLHEGAKVNLHDTNSNWYEISIDNENYGWVKKEAAVVI